MLFIVNWLNCSNDNQAIFFLFSAGLLFFKRCQGYTQLHTKWEGVGTSNFTTTTGHFFHYIESGFLVDHYYDITTSKMAF